MDSCISALATAVGTELKGKQDVLVSGTDIKTVNGSSLLGSGDIVISGGSGGTTYTPGNAICLTGDVIAVTTDCDAKWSMDSTGVVPSVNGCLGTVGLIKITDGGVGYRLDRDILNNKGSLGEGAVDFSYSSTVSSMGATGVNSFALGNYTGSFGENSVAMGLGSCALGTNSVAMGSSSCALGTNAFTVGCSNISSFCNTASFGYQTKAMCFGSFAIGSNTCSAGSYAFASGGSTTAGASFAATFGSSTRTYKINSIVFGECTQIGSNSGKIFAVGSGSSVLSNTTDDFNIHLSVDAISGLTCTKQLKIVDGTQAIGKVLTSDANGLAVWSNTSNLKTTYPQPLTYSVDMNYLNNLDVAPDCTFTINIANVTGGNFGPTFQRKTILQVTPSLAYIVAYCGDGDDDYMYMYKIEILNSKLVVTKKYKSFVDLTGAIYTDQVDLTAEAYYIKYG
jgi:hypothetical protein